MQTGTTGQPGGQLPPPRPTRATPEPFGRWATRNRVKVAVAVVGGLAISVANAWGVTAFRPGSARDLPRSALVHIEAGADVCWRANLGVEQGIARGCGGATYKLEPQSGEGLITSGGSRFFAEVTKTYERKVPGRVAIVLVVHGDVVDQASTVYESASVSY